MNSISSVWLGDNFCGVSTRVNSYGVAFWAPPYKAEVKGCATGRAAALNRFWAVWQPWEVTETTQSSGLSQLQTSPEMRGYIGCWMAPPTFSAITGSLYCASWKGIVSRTHRMSCLCHLLAQNICMHLRVSCCVSCRIQSGDRQRHEANHLGPCAREALGRNKNSPTFRWCKGNLFIKHRPLSVVWENSGFLLFWDDDQDYT